MKITDNLPMQPYKKFFGRQESINKIKETLLEGATFIASIDGVGGIGKTALAYYFCTEIIVPLDKFKYLVWLSSKNTVFDPFSKDTPIKAVENKFIGIESLIDTSFNVIGLEELIGNSLEEKKNFFENEILSKEPIFYVLDNLENIDDPEFFSYITRMFNKHAAKNSLLKILTTSRKRKRLVDFPVEIEGLNVEDALIMLKYLAKENQIKDILKSNDHDNNILIEKVGKVPLGIEFIIGQMSFGKTRGQIYTELEGYPTLEQVGDEVEKKKRLSDIILFSFKDMYETLGQKHQFVFQVIASLEKNKRKGESNISFELLMGITGSSRYELENILDTLSENKLIIVYESGEYSINQMAVNFVKQYYENFEKIEDEVVGKKVLLLKGEAKSLDKVDILLNNVRGLTEKNDYEKAEEELLKALDVSQDYRIYFELAKTQRILNKFGRASDNFRMATELCPTNSRIWYEWINMEDNRGRYNISLELTERALDKTYSDVSILIQRINIFKYKKDYENLRLTTIQFLDFYNLQVRNDDFLRLLRNWKNIEYKLVYEDKSSSYFKTVEWLIDKESEPETKLQLLNEELNIVRRLNLFEKELIIKRKIIIISENVLRTIGNRTKQLNLLFNAKNYEYAKIEAKKILSWIGREEENIEHSKNALRVLLTIYAIEKDFDRIMFNFDDYKKIGYKDANCIDIYEKAVKEKFKIQKNDLIQKISFNIQNSEHILRKIIMVSLNNDEELLRQLLIEKEKEEWLKQWEMTKSKALNDEAMLIYYSDLSHLRSVLSWCKNNIAPLSKERYKTKEILKNIIATLETYVSQERNETFHSRLQLYELSKLEEFLTDTNRLNESVVLLEENIL